MKISHARRWALAGAVLFSLLLLVPYAVTGFLLTGDVRDMHLPLEAFYRRELRAGHLPLWDPLSALGFPALASSQLGFWYPPLLALRFLPPEPAVAMNYLVHGALLAAGMFVYARSRRFSVAAALLSALALAGSGFIMGHLTHTNIFLGAAWMPWALWLTDLLAHTLRGRYLVFLGMTLALIALAGHFQIASMVAVFCGVRLFARLRAVHHGQPRMHTWWTLSLLLIPLGIFVLFLTAAQLFPTLELMRASSRGGGGGFDIARANQHSFPPWQTITFLIPAFFGMPDLSEYWGTRPQIEMAAWVGTLPLLFALVGAASTWRRRSAAPAPDTPSASPADGRFWTLAAIIGFLLALGRWSPLRLFGIEPTLGIFSGPARYLLLTEFSLAVLAGIGFDRVRTSAASSRVLRNVGVLGILGSLAVLAGFLGLRTAPLEIRTVAQAWADRVTTSGAQHVLAPEAYAAKVDYLLQRLDTWGVNLANPLIVLSVLQLAVGGGALVFAARRSPTLGNSMRRFLPAACCLLPAIELIALAWHLHPRVPWSDVALESPVVQVLHGRTPGRLYVVHPPGDTGLYFANPTTHDRDAHERLLRDLAVTNIFTRAGIPSIEWPAALDLADAARVLDRMRDAAGRPRDAHILDRLGVRYVAGSTATTDLQLPAPARELLAVSSREGTTIRVWERPTARPRVELLTSLPEEITDPSPAAVGAARITREHAQRIDIAVENPTAREAALVLRDTKFPGWRAMIDGSVVPVRRADTLFRGLVIPPGSHTVTFWYHPNVARLGILLSAVTWALLLVFLSATRGARAATP